LQCRPTTGTSDHDQIQYAHNGVGADAARDITPMRISGFSIMQMLLSIHDEETESQG
jgi:hypothetical protein